MDQKNNQEENSGLGELHPKEISLIKLIREEFRYGEIQIETRDGLPYRVIQRIISKIC